MPVFVVDSGSQPMVATGVVGESADMQQSAAGGWSNVGQKRCPDTGLLVWDVEVLYGQESYGRLSSVTAMVAVPAVAEPVVTALTPIRFTGLRVSVSVSKAKALVARWSAEGIAGDPSTGTASTASGSTSTASGAAGSGAGRGGRSSSLGTGAAGGDAA